VIFVEADTEKGETKGTGKGTGEAGMSRIKSDSISEQSQELRRFLTYEQGNDVFQFQIDGIKMASQLLLSVADEEAQMFEHEEGNRHTQVTV
jgi:hypothetical protein